jgi:F0F1-type ATP synthase membrane subunit b/b'
LAKKSAEAAARIEKARDSAMKEISTVATEAAADIVTKLIGTAPSKAEVEKAVAAARKA